MYFYRDGSICEVILRFLYRKYPPFHPIVYLLILAGGLLANSSAPSQKMAISDRPPVFTDRLSVAGIRGFRLDPSGVWIVEKGVVPSRLFPVLILLPGSTDQAGFGYPNHAITSLRYKPVIGLKEAKRNRFLYLFPVLVQQLDERSKIGLNASSRQILVSIMYMT